MTDHSCHVVTACTALLLGILAALPVQAQGGAMPAQGAGAGLPDGQASAARPGSGRDRPDQGAGPVKEEPDSARFGETVSPQVGEAEPEKLCAALSLGAAPAPKWQRSVLPDESWECFSERVFAAEQGGGSVFVILRGRAEDRVDGFRLKLNLLDETSGKGAQQAAEEILEAVFAARDKMLPKVLRTGLAEHVPFRQEIGGVAMEVRREFGPVPRYNVSVDFTPSPAQR